MLSFRCVCHAVSTIIVCESLNAYIKKTYRKGYADEFGLIPTQLFESNQILKSYGFKMLSPESGSDVEMGMGWTVSESEEPRPMGPVQEWAFVKDFEAETQTPFQPVEDGTNPR